MDALRRNPYVGPRAFQTGEALYGRDGDILNLYYLLLAERVVLLFSPSGAGKSSLIQAGLIPRLQEKFSFIALVRVNQEPPENLANRQGFNRYVFSTLSSLEESVEEDKRLPSGQLAEMSLTDYLTRRAQPGPAGDEPAKPIFEALIFDQFEEILTSDPNDYEVKNAFFDQLGEALRDNSRWALFSAREDYAAAFEPYLRAIPTRFANRYRLDLLDAGMALQAIQKPALEMGVDFSDAAAQKLVDDLRRVQTQRADGTAETELGRYVEPVQLQVVCYRLWDNLAAGETAITEKHIASIGSVDESLSAYYTDQVASGAETFKVAERIIREWFNNQLITNGGMRSQVMLEPGKSGGLDNAVIRFMESAHLVRAEKRAGSTWFELAHDRLIEPIRADNEKWLDAHLSLLQQEANLWDQQGRPDSLLLRDRELAQARLWAAEHQADLLPYERDFLAACQKEESRELRLKRRNQAISVLGGAAMILAIIAFWAYRQADIQRQAAQKQERFSRAGQLAAQANTALDSYPQRSLLLAVEANSVAEPGEQRPASAEEALRSALKDSHGLPLMGHEGPVNTVAFSPGGGWLATGSADHSARLWKMGPDGVLNNPLTLAGHEGSVTSVAFSFDGRWLATGSADHTARLWDLNATHPMDHPIVLRGHSGAINNLAFSPDTLSGTRTPSGTRTHWLATGSEDETLRLWDLEAADPSANSIELKGEGGWVQTLAFSPDGRWLAAGGPNSAWLWDLSTVGKGMRRINLPGHTQLVRAVAFSPDGRWLATGSADHTARLWDLSAPDPSINPQVLRGHGDWVNALAFSPDGRWLATGSGDHTARLWDIQSADPPAHPILLTGHSGPINTLAFSHGGSWLATGSQDGSVRLWNLADANPAVSPKVLRGHDASVNSLAFSPSDRWLATGGSDSAARLWDLVNPDPAVNPTVISGSTGEVSTLSFSPVQHWLATGGADDQARLWDLTSADPSSHPLVFAAHSGWIQILAFSPDQRWLATGSGDHTARLWDLNAAHPENQSIELAGHQDQIKTLAFSPRGHWLATGSADHTARLWDMSAPDPSANPKILSGHQGDVNALAFSPDGHWLATGSADNTARLWDLNAADPSANPHVLNGHQDDIFALAFSPDGHWLATGSGDHTARLWDLTAANPEDHSIELIGHQDQVKTLAFSPDGHWLATGSWDKTVRLWDLRAANPAANPKVLAGHEGWVNTLAFSPATLSGTRGHWLATGSEDHTARLWDLDSPDFENNPVVLSGHGDAVNILAFSPDSLSGTSSLWLATGSRDTTIRLWGVQLEALKSQACGIVGRNLSQKEWQQFFPGMSYHKTCAEWPEGR